MDDAFFQGFSRDLHDPGRWEMFYSMRRKQDPKLSSQTPPLPKIDARWLFNEMMAGARRPDPWMFPALQSLKSTGKYIIAAVSNTVIFPPGHTLHEENYFDSPIRSLFDIFVSSAHVGIRKPDPKIYELVLREINVYATEHANDEKIRSSGATGDITAKDVVFLDDIGENLRAAKKLGFRTIKVNLGRAFEAVDELENITGIKLAGTHARIPIRPDYHGTRARM